MPVPRCLGARLPRPGGPSAGEPTTGPGERCPAADGAAGWGKDGALPALGGPRVSFAGRARPGTLVHDAGSASFTGWAGYSGPRHCVPQGEGGRCASFAGWVGYSCPRRCASFTGWAGYSGPRHCVSPGVGVGLRRGYPFPAPPSPSSLGRLLLSVVLFVPPSPGSPATLVHGTEWVRRLGPGPLAIRWGLFVLVHWSATFDTLLDRVLSPSWFPVWLRSHRLWLLVLILFLWP